MINCKRATELASRRHEQKLSFAERTAFKFHLIMCSACKKFDRNVESLSGLMKDFNQPEKTSAPSAESENSNHKKQ